MHLKNVGLIRGDAGGTHENVAAPIIEVVRENGVCFNGHGRGPTRVVADCIVPVNIGDIFRTLGNGWKIVVGVFLMVDLHGGEGIVNVMNGVLELKLER